MGGVSPHVRSHPQSQATMMATQTRVLLCLCVALVVSSFICVEAKPRLTKKRGHISKGVNAGPKTNAGHKRLTSSGVSTISITDAPYIVQIENSCGDYHEGVILNATMILSRAPEESIEGFNACDFLSENPTSTVRVGASDGTGGTLYNVSEVYMYKSDIEDGVGMKENNVSLYRLEKALTFSDSVKAISIASNSSVPSTVRVVSFNLRLANESSSSLVLRSASMTVNSTSTDEESLFLVEELSSATLSSSGSPAINSKGELVGFHIGQDGSDYTFANVSYSTVLTFINDIMEGLPADDDIFYYGDADQIDYSDDYSNDNSGYITDWSYYDNM